MGYYDLSASPTFEAKGGWKVGSKVTLGPAGSLYENLSLDESRTTCEYSLGLSLTESAHRNQL